MKIKIYKNEQEEYIDVSNWSIVKAVFVGSLIINLIVLGVFMLIGLLWTFMGI